MFHGIWGHLKGVNEGRQIDYPMDRSPDIEEVREIVSNIDLNDYVICPNRREAYRIYKSLRDFDMQCITRSVMHKGKEVIKVWRIR